MTDQEYQECLDYFKQFGYEPSDNTFWFSKDEVYEISRNRNYEYVLRKAIFDEERIKDFLEEENYPEEATYHYWGFCEDAYKVIAVINPLKSLYYELLDGLNITSFCDISTYGPNRTIFGIQHENGTISYFNTYGHEFASKNEALNHLLTNDEYRYKQIDDVEFSIQPRFHYQPNKKLNILKIYGSYELSISMQSELAVYLLSHKYQKDFEVIQMSHTLIMLYINKKVVTYNLYGVCFKDRKIEEIEKKTKETELNYLVTKQLIQEKYNFPEKYTSPWERNRVKVIIAG